MLLDFLEIKDKKSNNLFDEENGLEHGNMFIDMYKPYKNYEVKKIMPKSKQDDLLLRILKYKFAINDLNLYLDLNPNDKEKYNLFVKYNELCKKAINEYNVNYYALELCDDTLNKYTWSTSKMNAFDV